jgi:hypothetical protein
VCDPSQSKSNDQEVQGSMTLAPLPGGDPEDERYQNCMTLNHAYPRVRYASAIHPIRANMPEKRKGVRVSRRHVGCRRVPYPQTMRNV